jgi:murein DD-endopeptidase MepM/ murein hydrolase activator NlpD
MSTTAHLRQALAVGSVVLAHVVVAHAGWLSALTLEVFSSARALKPGEAILLTVIPSRSLATLEGTAFDRAVSVWRENPSRWHVLTAIPLETTPGAATITLNAKSVDGEAASSGVPVIISAAAFETRQLKVDQRFVDPPKEMLPRITRESETLAAVFANSLPERLWRGEFRRPVTGRATSSFGRLSVLNGVERGRHQGADFRAATGTPVVAPNAGKIVLVANHYFSGRTVVIDHGGGLLSLFAHFSKVVVKQGEPVKAGEQLGLAGATGRVTGPHVHWAIRLNSTTVDPLSLMAALGGLTEKPAQRPE